MAMKDQLKELMEQAQLMQTQMQSAQKELSALNVTGESGAGLCKVTMNGRHDVSKVKYDSTLQDEKLELLEDLAAAAFNDAVRKIEKASQDKINQLTKNIKMPGDLNFPTEE